MDKVAAIAQLVGDDFLDLHVVSWLELCLTRGCTPGELDCARPVKREGRAIERTERKQTAREDADEPAPSIPFIDKTRERRDMWYLKRYGLPFLYWNLMLRGRA